MAERRIIPLCGDTTTTIGTGTVDIANALPSGEGALLTVAQALTAGDIATGETVDYTLIDGSAWEIGIGTITDAATDTLARTTLLRSSTGSKISLSGGTTKIILTPSHEQLSDALTPSGSTFPSNPVTGMHWVLALTNRSILYVYNGTTWGAIQSIGDMEMWVDGSSTEAGFSQDEYGGDTNGTNTQFATFQKAFDAIPATMGGNVTINVIGTVASDAELAGKVFGTPGHIRIVGEFTYAGAAVTITGHTENTGAAGTYGLLVQCGSSLADAAFYAFPSESSYDLVVAAKRGKPAANDVKLVGKHEQFYGTKPTAAPSSTTLHAFRNSKFIVNSTTTIRGFDNDTNYSGVLTIQGVSNVHIEHINFTYASGNGLVAENAKNLSLLATKHTDGFRCNSDCYVNCYGCSFEQVFFPRFNDANMWGCLASVSSASISSVVEAKDLSKLSFYSCTAENTATTANTLYALRLFNMSFSAGYSTSVAYVASTGASALAAYATFGSTGVEHTGIRATRGAGGTAYGVDATSNET